MKFWWFLTTLTKVFCRFLKTPRIFPNISWFLNISFKIFLIIHIWKFIRIFFIIFLGFFLERFLEFLFEFFLPFLKLFFEVCSRIFLPTCLYPILAKGILGTGSLSSTNRSQWHCFFRWVQTSVRFSGSGSQKVFGKIGLILKL